MCVMGPAAFAQANKLSVAQQGEVSIVNNTIWQPKHRHTLWYTEPAKVWMTSALPLGNGQLGACVMGGVKCDEVQFNEKTLWRGHVGSVTDHSAYGSYLDFGDGSISTMPVPGWHIQPKASVITANILCHIPTMCWRCATGQRKGVC